MKRFAELCGILESTSKTREKVAALIGYFQDAQPEDAMWAIRLLLGWKPPRVAQSHDLRDWAHEVIDVPEWLFEESYKTVGDLLETLALIVPLPEHPQDLPLHTWIQECLIPLHGFTVEERKTGVIAAWQQMKPQQRFIWNKLLTGGFRPHVSEKILTKALSAWRGLPKTVLACRLKNGWEPTVAAYRALFSHDIESLESSQPYPFQPLAVFDDERDISGKISDWQASWHWNGLRVQLVKRERKVLLWSEEQVLLNDTFPEIYAAMAAYPDGTVLDGTIVAWDHDASLNVAELERRLKRKRITKQLMQEIPARCWVGDLIEAHGEDLRTRDFRQRFERLQALATKQEGSPIQVILPVLASSWETLKTLRNQARQHGADGVLLKRLAAPYCSGQKGDQWILWRSVPLIATAVLLYIQLTDTSTGTRVLEGTFGVWMGESLAPVAKIASGFSDNDVYEIEAFAKEHTLDRFGPVRSLKPELVFTLAFDDVYPSSRHKSGVILQNPRIAQRQRKYSIQDADRLEIIQNYIVTCGRGGRT